MINTEAHNVSYVFLYIMIFHTFLRDIASSQLGDAMIL